MSARIVQNLLTFARSDTPEFKPMAMGAVISLAIELKRSEFKTSNIHVACTADDHVPATSIDPNQMLQMVLNLLNNSQQAFVESWTGATISIRITMDGDRVVTTFHDDGPGIPADIRERVFDPLFTTKDPDRAPAWD